MLSNDGVYVGAVSSVALTPDDCASSLLLRESTAAAAATAATVRFRRVSHLVAVSFFLVKRDGFAQKVASSSRGVTLNAYHCDSSLVK